MRIKEISAILLSLSSVSAHAEAPADKVLKAAQGVRAEQISLLEQLVNIDSGSADTAGIGRVQALLVPRLEALGAKVEKMPAEAPALGSNLVARLEGKGRGRILLIAHLDTVFPEGTAAKRPFRIDGERAYGPGIADEKGGVVEAVMALKLLHDLGEKNFGLITLLIESSEELGSPGSRKIIDSLSRAHDVELNLEPGDAPDAITVWRKGSATLHIDVQGRAAHAGINPQDGRNAALEVIHQLETLRAFPNAGDGLTANLAVVKSGERLNVIPDQASADVNIRVRTADQFLPIRSAFETAAQHVLIADTKVAVTFKPAFPPFAENAETQRLAALAKSIYRETGRTLTEAGNGGSSESALAAATGIPVLDGLGPVGGGFHAPEEFIEMQSLTPRLYLLTRMLISLGRNPPARGAGGQASQPDK